MIYTELTRRAMNLAYDAHHGQKDKCGVPYIYHPIHLAEQCKDELTTVVALLHDVVEDCPGYTFGHLQAEGIPQTALEALRLLTHEKNVPYLEYVKRIADNPIARQVKYLDLLHNLDETRIFADMEDAEKNHLQEKHELYRQALQILSGAGAEQ
ncbi:MAG: GTP pyrophosphokinase [Lachnospiraceae bacterium]